LTDRTIAAAVSLWVGASATWKLEAYRDQKGIDEKTMFICYRWRQWQVGVDESETPAVVPGAGGGLRGPEVDPGLTDSKWDAMSAGERIMVLLKTRKPKDVVPVQDGFQ